ncbi:MAG: MOSC domain-containing protein [Beijerinckiaceae bacterium]|jgi:MOSC domain-containing protein YiiM|nr:MOSC domain-containing protein [Beijerinckiaceae bacterium]
MLLPTLPVVLAGSVKPLPDDERLSGIDKFIIEGPWTITRSGLVGDAQADLKNHGGPEKALHQYPFDHYGSWKAETGPHRLLDSPGAFGENFCTSGWTEADICIGDIVRFGASVLQISQGRQPCWKLNKRFGRNDMAYAVQKSGRTGWYYRVLEEGKAESGDLLKLDHRPQPDWPLTRLTRLLYRDTDAKDELTCMAELPELAASWRLLARRRVETSKTEDWSSRLGAGAVGKLVCFL